MRARAAVAVLAALGALGGCASDEGRDAGQAVGEALEDRSVRFVADDGRLDPRTVGAVGRRLRTAGIPHEIDHDDVGLTISISDEVTPGPLARLAAAAATFEVRPAVTARAEDCTSPAPAGADVVLRDLRPAAAACWPAGPPIVTTGDVTEVLLSTDQESTLVVGLSPEGGARFDQAVAELAGRRVVVAVGGWVVSAPVLPEGRFAGRMAISLAETADAQLVEAVLTLPPLPEVLVEPTPTGPSGFGPSGDAE